VILRIRTTIIAILLLAGLISSPAMAASPFVLSITTQPSGAVNDVAFAIQPVVEIKDNMNQTVIIEDDDTVVTVALASGNGTLSGTPSLTVDKGVARFSGLKIVGTGDFTLSFTATGLGTVISESFTVTGAAAKLGITTQPSGAVNNVAFTGQPVIAIQDSGGNTVTSATNNISVTVTGPGTLEGTLIVTAVSGVATFSDLKIVGTGAHTLTFATSGGATLTSAISDSFTVAAATSSGGGGSTTVTTPVITPVITPVVVPGFFRGKKWTITKNNAGVSTIGVNLARSQAGKTALIYKRTKKGKLILLGEQRLGKNGRTVLQTEKPLRPGQKLRVQVDGKFRSTVTIP
jgi:hypothetical protein